MEIDFFLLAFFLLPLLYHTQSEMSYQKLSHDTMLPYGLMFLCLTFGPLEVLLSDLLRHCSRPSHYACVIARPHAVTRANQEKGGLGKR